MFESKERRDKDSDEAHAKDDAHEAAVDDSVDAITWKAMKIGAESLS